jgi:hypothetical protein
MRAIGVSSIALATMVLTATDVRSANNNWCAICKADRRHGSGA